MQVEVDGERVEVVASYPDLFPYFRFELQAPSLDLGRHQNPFSRALCLIGRGTDNWDVTDSLAEFLRDRLPLVVATASDPATDVAANTEEHQGEPLTSYYTYRPHAVVLIDGSWDLASDRGTMALGAEPTSIEPQILRGAVLSVRDARGAVIGEADARLARQFPVTLEGRWARLEAAPSRDDPDALLEELVRVDADLAVPHWCQPHGVQLDVIGGVVQEEVRWREQGDSWLFLVRARTRRATLPR
ncbi:MAG: hypothetical protein WEG56_04280 [Chloroflexota bacterium]